MRRKGEDRCSGRSINQIFSLHGNKKYRHEKTNCRRILQKCLQITWLPKVIVSDRDAKFNGKLWREIFKQLGTSLNMSSSYQPQIDGQTKVVNKCLESYLRCFVTDNQNHWSQWLHLAEWWYN